jgi:hypothetical protein
LLIVTLGLYIYSEIKKRRAEASGAAAE